MTTPLFTRARRRPRYRVDRSELVAQPAETMARRRRRVTLRPLVSAVALATTLGCHSASAPRSPAAPSARGECVMLAALGSPRVYVNDPAECSVETAPASTFKIPHALIALQTGALPSPGEIMSWDGSPQPFPAWERDHSLDSAVKASVVWFFQRTALLIGRDRMADWLARLGYGADTFDGEPTVFWLNGNLVVSPLEQLHFLRRLFRYELPVDRVHVDVVRSALLMPPGTLLNASGAHDFVLDWPSPVEVRAKTGSTRVGEESVSWLVGHIEAGGSEYVFVARARAREQIPGTAGADLARRVLNSIGPDALRAIP